MLPAADSISTVHGLRHTERIFDELFAGPTAGRRSLQTNEEENDKMAWLNLNNIKEDLSYLPIFCLSRFHHHCCRFVSSFCLSLFC